MQVTSSHPRRRMLSKSLRKPFTLHLENNTTNTRQKVKHFVPLLNYYSWQILTSVYIHEVLHVNSRIDILGVLYAYIQTIMYTVLSDLPSTLPSTISTRLRPLEHARIGQNTKGKLNFTYSPWSLFLTGAHNFVLITEFWGRKSESKLILHIPENIFPMWHDSSSVTEP